MPFDGLLINALVTELKDKVTNEKIEKVYQPEEDEIILKLRKYKLLLSANSNYPHICITNTQKTNPLSPPMFCMLLRKHLQGGKIIDIKQIDFERIIEFSIESYDELGNLVLKKLYCEIMGKHSNIILIDAKSNKVIDSIKRVPESISRIRQILPGLQYVLPPSQGKNNIFNIEYNYFINIMINSEKSLYKALYKNFQGLSPLTSQELCERSYINPDSNCNNITLDDLNRLWQKILDIKRIIFNKELRPNLVMNIKEKKVIDLCPFIYTIYDNSFYKFIFSSSISEMVEEYYYQKDKHERIKQKSLNIKKTLTTRVDRLYKKLQKLNEELLAASDADKFRLYGELIISNIYKISKGMSEIELENFYDNNRKIIIPLDVRLTPSENSQRYFKKYNKSKTALIKIKEQIDETKDELFYLENVLDNIDKAEDFNDIEDIKEELIEQNYIKRKTSRNKKKDTKSQPLVYYSTDGFLILVGKNNRQNDKLTVKEASKNDIWFHTKSIPGSHVVIKAEGRNVPETTLREAAKIAAYNSKARYSSNVPVDYTLIKNVKKPTGAKPGMVIYNDYNTIYVTPVEEEINKLKK